MKHFIVAVVLAITCGSLGSAQDQGNRGPGGGQRFIVVLHDGVDVDTVIAEHGASADHVYKNALNGFAGPLGVALASALAEDPRVKNVEPDGEVRAIGETLPWGVDRVDADLSSTKAGDGSGSVNIGIAVIDTGIDKAHPDLNIVGGVNYSGGNSSNWTDGNGHGTHVSGTAAAKDTGSGVVGVAPGAKLWSVRVLGPSGSGSISGVIAGVNWVAARSADIAVANMSLGGGISPSLDGAVKNAIGAGVTFCVAAGNSNADANSSSPARVPEAITVAASDSNNNFASFSNWNLGVVDLIAPGVSILSTYKGGKYATMSGTSMASPHCAGGAALCYLKLKADNQADSSKPAPTPDNIQKALVGSASIFVAGPDGAYPLLNVAGY